MRVQIKIALIFTLVCSVVLIGLSLAVYLYANEKAFQDFYARLELRANIAAKANLGPDTLSKTAYEQVRYQVLQQLPEEKEFIVPADSLKHSGKGTLAGSLPRRFVSDLTTYKHAVYREDYEFYKGIYYHNNKGEYAIVVTAVHSYAKNFLFNLKTILVAANLICPFLMFGIGVFFSNHILAPIRKINQAVKDINATSLNNRLSVKPGKDELSELGHTFNRMLARLETSFETQNNFVSNASHELNTPLTAIIGEAEFSLSKTRTPEQYQQGLTVILGQAEKLKNIVKSLLELAQSGFSGNLSFEWVRIAELVQNVLKVSNSIYPDCRVVNDTSVEPANIHDISIMGNFHLLELCISNILLNACKYSTGENVTFAVGATDKHVLFVIRDKGIGIPAADIPHIFDPFFRASNVKQSSGYGIGLPLAQNIIHLHHGTINITSRESEGTEVLVKFPLNA